MSGSRQAFQNGGKGAEGCDLVVVSPEPPQVSADQGQDVPWTFVDWHKQQTAGRLVSKKRNKSSALIIRTGGECKHSEILRPIRRDVKDLRADVRSIRRTGELILELKRGKERVGVAYKILAEEVLSEAFLVKN